MISFVDLNRQYDQIKDEVHRAIDEVIRSKAFVQGKYAKVFEEEYAKLHGLKHVIGCSSGSTALVIAASALGLEPGDEVITTTHTFIATVEPVHHLRAKTVLVDIDPVTYNIDPVKIESAVTGKTKAIIPVHLYGNPADMDAVMAVAKKHRLLVLEDCAHAHLAKYKGRFVGTFGDINAFSFNPGKNLGAYGDAGAVATADERLYKLASKIYDHGRLNNYEHDVVGYNLRIDGIQAAVLSVKLKYIEQWTKMRQENAAKYNELFAGNSRVTTPVVAEGCEHVYHLYIIQVGNRDHVMKVLKERGVDVRNQYPVPLHLQPALSYLGYKRGDFPVAEALAGRVIALPIFPEITDEEIHFIADIVNNESK